MEEKEDEFVMVVVTDIVKDILDYDEHGKAEMTSLQRLHRVHKNLGHPPNRLLVQILREAKAPQSVIDQAKDLHCPICARCTRVAPSRPANPNRARELGEVVAMDISFHSTPTGEKLTILHFIDEASRFHIAKVLREGKCNDYNAIGNCEAEDLIGAIVEWARYMQHLVCFHVDEEGIFLSDRFN